MRRTLTLWLLAVVCATTVSAQQQTTRTVDDAIADLEKAAAALDVAIAALKDATQPPSTPCTYAVNAPSSVAVPASGGSGGDVAITTAAGCGWNATASASWIQAQPATGAGSGPVMITVAANADGKRTGTVTLAGTTGTATVVTIVQDAVPPTPTTDRPTDAASFAAALLKGGTITIGKGVKIVGNFIVSVDGTTIRGDATLPAGRVADGATVGLIEGGATAPPPGVLPQPTLLIQANNVTITGLEVHTGAGHRNQAAIQAGSVTTKDPMSQPDNFTVDRNEVKGIPGATQKGLEVHTRKATITNNRVTGFLLSTTLYGAESQGLISWNGPGPYLIENNLLEASGENVMFGGATTMAPEMIPSDIVFRNNDLNKPEEWRKTPGSVKNTFELKCAHRVLVEKNRFTGMWKDAQPGNAVLLTPRNQYGKSEFCGVEDVTIQDNVIDRHTDGYAFNILGSDNVNPTQRTRRVTIRRNLAKTSPKAIQISNGVDEYLIVDHNTFAATKWNLVAFADGTALTPLSFTYNVSALGAYGFSGPCCAPGNAVIATYTAPGSIVTNNILEKTPERSIPMPAGNTLLAPGGLAPLLDPVTFKYLPGGYGY